MTVWELEAAPSAGRVAAPPEGYWRLRWAIQVSVAAHPLSVKAGPLPTITGKHVTDIRAGFVADPFLLGRPDALYLFFEAWNSDRDRGELAFSTSVDEGRTWQYGGVMLREPFHLSYPQVFEWGGEVWMIPETRQDRSVRLYRAAAFPHRWVHEATLLRGLYADATVLRHDDRWWLFAQRGLDEMRLFFSRDLGGGWHEHPASPFWPGNRRRTRPGGRILNIGGSLVRFAQDGLPRYGFSLRPFAIDHLDEERYIEHELPGSPILKATGVGWTASAIHHLDAVPLDRGGWLTVIDGAASGFY